MRLSVVMISKNEKSEAPAQWLLCEGFEEGRRATRDSSAVSGPDLSPGAERLGGLASARLRVCPAPDRTQQPLPLGMPHVP